MAYYMLVYMADTLEIGLCRLIFKPLFLRSCSGTPRDEET